MKLSFGTRHVVVKVAAAVVALAVVVPLGLRSGPPARAAEPAIAPAGIVSARAPYAADAKSSIERLDPALDALLAPAAVVELLASGFNWSEGPVWMPAQQALLFSDVPENRVYQWKEGAGISVRLEPSGFTGVGFTGREPGSNGLALDPQGRLVLAQHGDRRVARLAADGKTFETIVARTEGKRFSSPNDLCYDRAGNLYFTDPPYGLPKDTPQETEFHGVYRLGADGVLTVIARDLTRPNGIALSPDERTLYVGNSDGKAPWVKAYTLNVDGAVAGSRIFFDGTELIARTKRRGGFDGLKVDRAGNVWTTGPGGVLILSAEGKHLGTILTGRATANCAFGGEDGRTFYVTADDALLRVRTQVVGAGDGVFEGIVFADKKNDVVVGVTLTDAGLIDYCRGPVPDVPRAIGAKVFSRLKVETP